MALKRSLMKGFVATVARANGVLTPAQEEEAGKFWRGMVQTHHKMGESRR